MADRPPALLERRRTGWDIAFGVLSVVAGGVILGHTAVASLVSVIFLGWMLVIGGLTLAISAVATWKDAAHRWNLPAGALLLVLGIGFLRNPGSGLLALTLVAGSLLLVGGVVRIVAAFQPRAPRAVLLTNGVITLLLGILVLNRWPVSALWFLGTVLGVQLIVDGVTTAMVGRLRVTETEPAPAPQPQAPTPTAPTG